MKYILKDNHPLIKFNEETIDVSVEPQRREAINRIYMINEPGVLSTEDGEVNVKNGDIIVVFYEGKYPKRTIVVKSKDWKNNIEAYEDALQEEKEKWALKKCCDCERESNCEA